MLLASISPNLRIIHKSLSLSHLLTPSYLRILATCSKLYAIINIEWVHLTCINDIQIVGLVQYLLTTHYRLVHDNCVVLYHTSIQLVIVYINDLIYKATFFRSVVLLRLDFVYVHSGVILVSGVGVYHVLTVEGEEVQIRHVRLICDSRHLYSRDIVLTTRIVLVSRLGWHTPTEKT